MPNSIRAAGAAVRAPVSTSTHAPRLAAARSVALRGGRARVDAVDGAGAAAARALVSGGAAPAPTLALVTPGTSAPARTSALQAQTQSASLLEPLDGAYAEPFRFTAEQLASGKKLYAANVSIFTMQRGFNRLAAKIAAERPDLVASYQSRMPAPFPYALVVDGQLGPNTNTAKMLLQEYLGGSADEHVFSAADWQRLDEALAASTPAPWVTLGFELDAFTEPEERNAALVWRALAFEDPATLMKLAAVFGTPRETPYGEVEISATMVQALATRMRELGVPLTDERMVSMYELDRTGRGGVTFMRARGVAELIVELERFDHREKDELIHAAVAWIEQAEPEAFARFARVCGAPDPRLVLAALIKATMSAESDFDRAADHDLSDVGLMQLTHLVTTDKRRYFEEEVPSTIDVPASAAPTDEAAPAPVLSPSFPENALEPLRNTAAGGSLLMALYSRFDGHMTFIPAAYNVGPNKRELNLPPDEARIPNYYPTLAHGMRIQRRFPFYLEQMRAAPGA